ncbi:MAG: exodeoxyribonuclease V subunit gamma, partial [Deltaproteobacteria bacterium]|nr:exodeoxyribonuclease V subunit gamma [Deltaproteobacteria bacterium]
AGLVTEIHLFVLSPSQEYWAHIHSKRGVVHDLKTYDKDLHIEHGNPLLASLGRMGRDFQEALEDSGPYCEPADDLYKDPAVRSPCGLLRTLQSDILHLRDRRAEADTPDELPKTISSDDASVIIHSCHSPMREVEVLRDQILALLDDRDLRLYPEDILVMMPAIETYAPHIDAVFARESDRASEIPYQIAGLSSRQDSEVRDAFVALLDLAKGRVTIHEVFDLLRVAPVRERFGLDEADVDIANKWIEDAGVRWGIDKAHRMAHGQPEFEENTWRFGLRRLLLGYAMPDKEESLFGGTLPYDDLEGRQTEILG